MNQCPPKWNIVTVNNVADKNVFLVDFNIQVLLSNS